MDDCLDSGPLSKCIEADIRCQSPFRVILCRFLLGRKPAVPARCIQAWNISFNGGWAICRSKMIPGRKMLSGNLSKPLESSGDERQRGNASASQLVTYRQTGLEMRANEARKLLCTWHGTRYATGDKLRHEKLFSVKGDPKQPEQTDLAKISPVSGQYRGKSHNLAHNYNGSENNSVRFVFLTIEEMLLLFQIHY